jgi:hypothetical protein
MYCPVLWVHYTLFTIIGNFVVEKYMGKRKNRLSKRIKTSQPINPFGGRDDFL